MEKDFHASLCFSRRGTLSVVSILKSSPLPPADTRSRLFREATQLKSVGTAVRAAGIEACHIEIQIHPVSAFH